MYGQIIKEDRSRAKADICIIPLKAEFSLIGILSGITGALAESGIGVFAISTYQTDYVLIKKEDFERALMVLEKKGYAIGDVL